jgi:hypothetical protein
MFFEELIDFVIIIKLSIILLEILNLVDIVVLESF